MQYITNVVVIILTTVSVVLWVATKTVIRPKYNAVQTLHGGAVWSQLVFSVGNIVTHATKPTSYKTVLIYFLSSSIMIVSAAAVIMVSVC